MFNVKPKALFEVSTSSGKKIREFLYTPPYYYKKFIGVIFRYGTFADHRSGWSALIAEIGLGFWTTSFIVCCWRNEPGNNEYIFLSLRETFEKEHGKHKFVPDEDEND